jgi:hypothetical protein
MLKKHSWTAVLLIFYLVGPLYADLDSSISLLYLDLADELDSGEERLSLLKASLIFYPESSEAFAKLALEYRDVPALAIPLALQSLENQTWKPGRTNLEDDVRKLLAEQYYKIGDLNRAASYISRYSDEFALELSSRIFAGSTDGLEFIKEGQSLFPENPVFHQLRFKYDDQYKKQILNGALNLSLRQNVLSFFDIEILKAIESPVLRRRVIDYYDFQPGTFIELFAMLSKDSISIQELQIILENFMPVNYSHIVDFYSLLEDPQLQQVFQEWFQNFSGSLDIDTDFPDFSIGTIMVEAGQVVSIDYDRNRDGIYDERYEFDEDELTAITVNRIGELEEIDQLMNEQWYFELRDRKEVFRITRQRDLEKSQYILRADSLYLQTEVDAEDLFIGLDFSRAIGIQPDRYMDIAKEYLEYLEENLENRMVQEGFQRMRQYLSGKELIKVAQNIVAARRDLDRDGLFETREVYFNNRLAGTSTDLDLDGNPEYSESYQFGSAQYWDINDDGIYDIRFRNQGRLQEYSSQLNGIIDFRVFFNDRGMPFTLEKDGVAHRLIPYNSRIFWIDQAKNMYIPEETVGYFATETAEFWIYNLGEYRFIMEL